MDKPDHASGSTRAFDVIIERDEDGTLVATVPDLPGCHTQARSQDELMSRIREAIQLYLEEADEPAPPSRFLGVQKVEVPA